MNMEKFIIDMQLSKIFYNLELSFYIKFDTENISIFFITSITYYFVAGIS